MRVAILLRDEKGKEYFLDYCTIWDNFITVGLSEKNFRKHLSLCGWSRFIINNYISQCKKKGTSSKIYTVPSIILSNRAGKYETSLSLYQIINLFCKRKTRKTRPLGKFHE